MSDNKTDKLAKEASDIAKEMSDASVLYYQTMKNLGEKAKKLKESMYSKIREISGVDTFVSQGKIMAYISEEGVINATRNEDDGANKESGALRSIPRLVTTDLSLHLRNTLHPEKIGICGHVDEFRMAVEGNKKVTDIVYVVFVSPGFADEWEDMTKWAVVRYAMYQKIRVHILFASISHEPIKKDNEFVAKLMNGEVKIERIKYDDMKQDDKIPKFAGIIYYRDDMGVIAWSENIEASATLRKNLGRYHVLQKK